MKIKNAQKLDKINKNMIEVYTMVAEKK